MTTTSILLRHPLLHTTLTLTALAGATYNLRSHHIYNLEEHEARMDELEGTLRGHIGLIEDSLGRIEGKALTGDGGGRVDEIYRGRGRNEKKDGKSEGKGEEEGA